jgi:hypothetical protein
MELPEEYALSLKQPWATLLVTGRKTIEVRRWPTVRRGRVLIHAAGTADKRSEAWRLIPWTLLPAARRTGGILGAGELTDCIDYRTAEAFTADQKRHLNRPNWFEGPVVYGLVFAGLVELPFRRCRGGRRFFPVSGECPRHPQTSVRTCGERVVAGWLWDDEEP